MLLYPHIRGHLHLGLEAIGFNRILTRNEGLDKDTDREEGHATHYASVNIQCTILCSLLLLVLVEMVPIVKSQSLN